MNDRRRQHALLRFGTLLVVSVVATAILSACGTDTPATSMPAGSGAQPTATSISTAVASPTPGAVMSTPTQGHGASGSSTPTAMTDTPTATDTPSTAGPTSTPKPTVAPTASHFPPGIGDMAPDFTLPIATGGEITLSQFRGDRPIVLVFYRAFW